MAEEIELPKRRLSVSVISIEGVSLDRAWDATQAAIKDMGFIVTADVLNNFNMN